MKKSVLTMVISAFSVAMIMLIFSASLLAQPRRPDPAEMAKRETEMMKKDLDLSKDQLVSVSEINERYAGLKSEMFSEKNSDREAMHEKMMELDKKKDEELKLVLSEGQYEEWTAIREKMRRRGPGNGQEPPERK